MELMKGDDLQDFLDLAIRHGVIDKYEFGRYQVTVSIDEKDHKLDHHQVWKFLSVILYERFRQIALVDAIEP